MIKRIVCLANSRKLQGRCIAGRELHGENPGPWVRPVSDRSHEEVSEYERQYEDGSDPGLLDVIAVPLLEQRPNPYQPENWLLDPDEYWVNEGRFSGALDALIEHPPSLWATGYHTFNGTNDYLPVDEAAAAGSSLAFISVSAIDVNVFKPGEAFGNPKRRVQARFRFGVDEYALWVTDPPVEKAYLAKPDGTYAVGAHYLTISLGEPYEGRCYKLVAAMIARAEGSS